MKKPLVIASTVLCTAVGLSLTPLAAQAASAPPARDGAATSTTFSDEGSADGVDRSAVVDGDGPSTFGTIVHPEGGEWHYGVTGVLV
ncbi:hypothetical protein AS850_13140 [Frondihabitans sp. 762G35]|uniref:hypothetical protein n=1 Tax=Frondihabitans sp. 762G35 TaxID=1446794 RepID=UPI000D209C18|nr:hypothetical protein [Frondihabitans sp. 762G35]ARC58023.1 hypothetical protein AS850_13140 [Frondihabitans sp. 762G35]